MENLTILLINPDFPHETPWGCPKLLPPLGLAYIGSTLEGAGFQVKLLDNHLLKKPADYIKREIERLNPEVVGISCNSINYERCIGIAKAAKEVDSNTKVVVGGPHPTCLPESVLEHREIDYAVIGEGETAMLELAKCFAEGSGLKKISKSPGIAYKHAGRVVKNSPQFIEELDKIPPAWHLLQLPLYDRKIEYLNVEPVDVMNVVRGCPYNCKYCEAKDLWGPVSRAFSPKRIVEEVEHLANNYGTRGLYFIGDNFTINKKRTIEFCELLKERKLNVEWVCDTRVDLVSRDMLKKMREAGCRTIWFGVESGSPRILQKINKGITLEQAVAAFKLCREADIQTACSFLMGIPGETLKDMEATFRFAEKLNPDWCRFNVLIAVPGSELYEEIIRENLYSRMEGFVAFVRTKDFDYDSLLEIRNIFHKKFHRSPRRVFQRVWRKILLSLIKP